MGQSKKPVSEIDKKLAVLASEFELAYGNGNWLSERQRVPSSATPESSGISKRRPKANRVETRSDLPDKPIRGFINETLFLKNFLLKGKATEGFKTLAIVGKFGVGKTTLCQDVFNNEDVKQAYLPRIWVSMFSEETKEDEDPKIAVVKRVLRSLGVEDEMFDDIKREAKEEKHTTAEEGKTEEETVEEKELSRLLRALNSNLIGKKYLIVLDDVWEDNEWNQRLDEEKIQQQESHLSCGFPKGCGGRVIVTSRDERLAKKIVGEEDNLQRLFPRSDPESVLEIYNDAFGEHMKDAAEKLMKDAAMKDAARESMYFAVKKLMKDAAGESMKGALVKHMKDAAGESMKDAAVIMEDALVKLMKDAAEESTKDAVDELRKDAAREFMKDAVDKLRKDAAEEFMKDAAEKLMKDAVEKLMKDAGGKPMKDTADKLMKDAVEKFVKDAVEKLMKDAGGKLVEDAHSKQKKWEVNPRYPRRYKQELMDKSCGIPWVAQKLAKIEPLKNDEDQEK